MASFTIQKRTTKAGVIRYRSLVRLLDKDVCVYSTSRTFSKKIAATTWGKQRVLELEEDGIPKPNADVTVKMLISDYLNHKDVKVGRTKEYTLKYLLGCEISNIIITDLEAADIVKHCSDRIATGITPATVNHDVSYLRSIYKIAKTLWRYEINDKLFEEALPTLHHLNLVGRSQRRSRRPTAVELDKLIVGLEKRQASNLSEIPYVDILNFSILSCMRIGEICTLRWDDLDQEQRAILVRDRKDPRKKAGNHMVVPLLGGAFELITKQEQKSDLIFPYNARSITAGYQRVRDVLEIKDLRYHDLRREGASRLFEKGYDIVDVAQVTGHRNINTLWQIYTELYPNRVHDKELF